MAPGCGVTLLPGMARIRPLMMTRSVGANPAADHAQVAAQWADLDQLRHHGAIGGHGHDQLARLVRHDGRIRHQQHRLPHGGRQPQPGELAGGDEQIRVRQGGARVQRAAAAVHLVVEEVELAMPWPALLVAERGLDRMVDRATMAGALQVALIGEVVALAHVEIQVDRVERDDGGQQRHRADALAAEDQVADRGPVHADSPADRGGDAG